jgi:hypothetical protein
MILKRILSSSVGRRFLIFGALALVLGLTTWGVQRHLRLQRLYHAVSVSLTKEHELVQSQVTRIKELEGDAKKLAESVDRAGRGAVIDTHATASKVEEVEAGTISYTPTTIVWEDDHQRFRFTDPNLQVEGDERLTVSQRFRIDSLTVRLPDDTHATKLALWELSPRTGEDLWSLPVDVDSKVFDTGKPPRPRWWQRFDIVVGPYLGVSSELDGSLGVGVAFGYRLGGQRSQARHVSPSRHPPPPHMGQ